MNASEIANADQLHAEVIDARCCDALDPCEACRAKAVEVRRVHRGLRAERRQSVNISGSRDATPTSVGGCLS